MGDFQSTINYNQALGVVGELAFSGPQRAAPYNLVSTPQLNVIGRAFTVTNGGDPDPVAGAPNAGQAQVGGAGVFAGILVSPKEYASFGGATGPLSPTITLPDNSIGYLLTMGYIFASLTTTGNLVGNLVYYDNTTGILGSTTPTGAATGAATAEVTLTVSAISAGTIGIGSKVYGTNAAGVEVIALGTGTGGNGTYTLNKAVSVAGAITFTSVAPSGKTLVPNCRVARYDSSAAAIATGSCNAVIELNN